MKKSSKKSNKKSWDAVSVSLFAVVAVIAVVVIVFFVARERKDVLIDSQGSTHVVVTDIKGNFVQDEFGNLFEKVTDENGEKATKSYIFPDRITNKKGNKIENAFIKLKLPKGWSDYSTNDYVAMQHSGDCLTMNKPLCEVKIRYDIMADPNTLYETEKGYDRYLVERVSGFADLKEYETTVLGLEARAMSYSANNGEGTYYYYIVEKGLALFEIKVYAHNDCYSEADIIELIGKAYELKDLGGERPEIPSTEAVTEEEYIEDTITTAAAE